VIYEAETETDVTQTHFMDKWRICMYETETHCFVGIL
jgi:hypothetical protein